MSQTSPDFPLFSDPPPRLHLHARSPRWLPRPLPLQAMPVRALPLRAATRVLPARWPLRAMPARCYGLLALSIALTAWFFLSIRTTPELALHEAQTRVAFGFALLTAPIFGGLAILMSNGRKRRVGALMLLAALLADATVMLAYSASMGLFGL